MTDSSNLDLVRSIYEDWERGDYSRADWAHPDMEFVVTDGPDPGRWVGVASIAEVWRNRLASAHDLRSIADQYREMDDERVLVLFHHSGRGKVSGIELEQTRGGANLFHLRDGKVTRFLIYFDRDRAFADLGLTPEGNDQQG